MFEMKRALLAYQHHVVPNRSERELFPKHSDRKLFFFYGYLWTHDCDMWSLKTRDAWVIACCFGCLCVYKSLPTQRIWFPFSPEEGSWKERDLKWSFCSDSFLGVSEKAFSKRAYPSEEVIRQRADQKHLTVNAATNLSLFLFFFAITYNPKWKKKYH